METKPHATLFGTSLSKENYKLSNTGLKWETTIIVFFKVTLVFWGALLNSPWQQGNMMKERWAGL